MIYDLDGALTFRVICSECNFGPLHPKTAENLYEGAFVLNLMQHGAFKSIERHGREQHKEPDVSQREIIE